ncbi:hypothetical protein PTKIN_Ptkin03bG0011500 [Pterospermum kingtungense]
MADPRYPVYDTEYLGQSVFDITTDDYRGFINSFIRSERGLSKKTLVSEKVHGEPKLLLESLESAGKVRYFDIKFKAGEESSCYCRFYAANLYLIAFSPDNKNWFELGKWKTNFDVNLSMRKLGGITVNYNSLETKWVYRRNIKISKERVKLAITALGAYKEVKGRDTKVLKSHLLLFTQLVSEAIRIPRILDKIANEFDTGVVLDDLVDLEDRYDKNCCQFTNDLIKERLDTEFVMPADAFNNVAVVLEGFDTTYEDYEEKNKKKGKNARRTVYYRVKRV